MLYLASEGNNSFSALSSAAPYLVSKAWHTITYTQTSIMLTNSFVFVTVLYILAGIVDIEQENNAALLCIIPVIPLLKSKLWLRNK